MVDQVPDAHLGGAEHVVEAVAVVLQPELVASLHVGGGVAADMVGVVGKWVGIRAVDDGLGVGVDGPGSFLQLAGEPVVPTAKAPVRFAPVKLEVLILCSLVGLGVEPAVFLVLGNVLQRLFGEKHDLVVVEDVLEVGVGDWAAEEALTEFGVDEVDEEGVEGDSGELGVLKFGGSRANVVHAMKDMLDGEPMEDASLGNCGNASCYVHLQHWVLVDAPPEILDRPDEGSVGLHALFPLLQLLVAVGLHYRPRNSRQSSIPVRHAFSQLLLTHRLHENQIYLYRDIAGINSSPACLFQLQKLTIAWRVILQPQTLQLAHVCRIHDQTGI